MHYMHCSSTRRLRLAALLCVALASSPLHAQKPDSSSGSAVFITHRDLAAAGIAFTATGILSIFDPPIARRSQEKDFQGTGLRSFTTHASKVNETTLTVTGILAYGIGRLSHASVLTDVALHATESVVLASVASQLIRGPLGRTRPYVTNDSNQYDFHFFRGFIGDSSFDYRSFPSIHMSSSMAVATVLTMETHRRAPGATPIVAPLLYAAALLPGLSRIELNQHWASDIAAGAFMGVFAGYKVVSYSHAHPNNRFDRVLLSATVIPGPNRSLEIAFSPF
jgi:membrane-associated phospholipid phosphatase